MKTIKTNTLTTLMVLIISTVFIFNTYGQVVHINKVVDKKGIIINITVNNNGTKVATIEDYQSLYQVVSLPTRQEIQTQDEVTYREVGNGKCEIILINPGSGKGHKP